MPITRKSVPNLLTALRLALIPVLWVFAFLGDAVAVGVGFFLGWLTDALDGFLARRFRATTAWGSRFDSITDTLLVVSGVAWVAMLRPEFIVEHAVPLALWLAIGTMAYVIGWLRFRRVADVHLYSAKAANFVGFLFVAYLLTFGTYPLAVFWVVMGICLLAAAETLVVFATFDRVDEHVGTVLRPPRSNPSTPG